jgi:anti-sigma regulatory factor (Ser/Thr protein kinase)
MEFKKTMKNDLSELQGLAGEVSAFAGKLEISPKSSYALELALEEMITNIVKYGYDDSEEHFIEVILEDTGAGELKLSLSDDGHEFNPLEILKPDTSSKVDSRPVGGVGIHLTRSMVDRMEYARERGRNLLRIFIKK